MYFGKARKKLRVLTLLMVAVLMAGVFTGCGKSGDAAKTGDSVSPDASNNGKGSEEVTELSLSFMWGATHALNKEIIPQWNETLDKETNGRVKIVTYPGSTLTSPTEAYDGVVEGISDMAIVSYTLIRGKFPIVEAFFMPGVMYNNTYAATYTFNEGFEEFKPAEHDDTVFLWGLAAGPGDIQSQTPVRTLEDIKGLQIGVNSGFAVDAMTMLGASPINMPTPDWYEALQRGVMNSTLIAGEVLKGYRQYEVNADYVTVTPQLWNANFGMVINKEKFESLAPDIQAALKKMPESIPGLWGELNAEGYRFAHEKGKVKEVFTFTDEEYAKLNEIIKPLRDKKVEELNSKGLPGEEIVDRIYELADKYNKEYPEVAPYVAPFMK